LHQIELALPAHAELHVLVHRHIVRPLKALPYEGRGQQIPHVFIFQLTQASRIERLSRTSAAP
jgi:hypothetical protein